MIIIDTTVWINYLNGVLHRKQIGSTLKLDRRRFGLTDLILCEVLQGLSSEREAAQVVLTLAKFGFSPPGGVRRATASLHSTTALCGREV